MCCAANAEMCEKDFNGRPLQHGHAGTGSSCNKKKLKQETAAKKDKGKFNKYNSSLAVSNRVFVSRGARLKYDAEV